MKEHFDLVNQRISAVDIVTVVKFPALQNKIQAEEQPGKVT